MFLFVAIVTTVAFVQEKSEGQKLFEAMEKAVNDAEIISVKVESSFSGQGSKGKGKGSVTHQKRGKSHVVFAESRDLKKFDEAFKIVSDGIKSDVYTDRGRIFGQAILKDYDAKLSMLLTRSGYCPWIFENGQRSDKDMKILAITYFRSSSSVRNFVVEKKEKVAGLSATVLKYSLEYGELPFIARLWVDDETKLPLKRLMEADGADLRLEESYDVRVMKSVDPKLFSLSR